MAHSSDSRFDRRSLLIGAGAAGLAAPLRALAQAPVIPGWKTEFKRLAPNVYAFIRGGGPGLPNGGLSNAGVIIGPDNVTLVDALGPPMHAKEFKRAIEGVTTKRVTRIINTHHHRDHTNGDYVFEPVEIVMSPTMAKMDIEDGIPAHPWANRPNLLEGIEDLKFAPPTTIISGEVTYLLGDIEARVLFPGAGHTFGDLMVYLPKQKILFAGDIAFFYATPAMAGADPDHWQTICADIQKMDIDIIVPGHGPTGTKKDLADMAEFMRVIEVEIRKGYDAGKTPGRAAADANIGRFGGWAEQERLAWAAPRLYELWRTGKLNAREDTAAQAKAIAEYHALVER